MSETAVHLTLLSLREPRCSLHFWNFRNGHATDTISVAKVLGVFLDEVGESKRRAADTDQPQVLHTYTGAFTDKTRLCQARGRPELAGQAPDAADRSHHRRCGQPGAAGGAAADRQEDGGAGGDGRGEAGLRHGHDYFSLHYTHTHTHTRTRTLTRIFFKCMWLVAAIVYYLTYYLYHLLPPMMTDGANADEPQAAKSP